MSNQPSSSSRKQSRYIGKIGMVLIVIGLSVLYYDGYKIMQAFPKNYQFYNHPEIHVPAIGIMLAFIGTCLFIVNFRKGGKVI